MLRCDRRVDQSHARVGMACWDVLELAGSMAVRSQCHAHGTVPALDDRCPSGKLI